MPGLIQGNIPTRTIFCRDNLDVMHGMDSESVDLIYLDPPFNKGRYFHTPIGGTAEGATFKDIWESGDTKDEWHGLIADKYPKLYDYLAGVESAGSKSAKYYLIYMAVRMLEMHRILRPTGSLYLHCDPTASHYLKLLLDVIFGHSNFRNEIIWQRAHPHSDAKRYGNCADQILFYTKSNDYFWNTPTRPLDEAQIAEKYKHKDAEERHYRLGDLHATGLSGGGYQYVWNGIDRLWRTPKKRMQQAHNADELHYTKSGMAYKRIYLDEHKGVPLQNIWTDIPYVAGKERQGYPTQKPVALLERIIAASCPELGVVFDPFCGCATTCVAAERLQRMWIGVDISPAAYKLTKKRMNEEVPDDLLGPLFDINFSVQPPQRTDAGLIPLPPDIRHALYGMQEGVCVGCEQMFGFRHFELDHIVPRAKGGGNQRENLQLLCGSCNRLKGDRDMAYLKARLKTLSPPSFLSTK